MEETESENWNKTSRHFRLITKRLSSSEMAFFFLFSRHYGCTRSVVDKPSKLRLQS